MDLQFGQKVSSSSSVAGPYSPVTFTSVMTSSQLKHVRMYVATAT